MLTAIGAVAAALVAPHGLADGPTTAATREGVFFATDIGAARKRIRRSLVRRTRRGAVQVPAGAKKRTGARAAPAADDIGELSAQALAVYRYVTGPGSVGLAVVQPWAGGLQLTPAAFRPHSDMPTWQPAEPAWPSPVVVMTEEPEPPLPVVVAAEIPREPTRWWPAIMLILGGCLLGATINATLASLRHRWKPRVELLPPLRGLPTTPSGAPMPRVRPTMGPRRPRW